MDTLIKGIHHVSAITGDAQQNIDFYLGVLGLRMVKRTVNFDEPEVSHYFYGDDAGNPGSILTFFPYPGLVRGRQGKGMVHTTAFSVPESSRGFWTDRFTRLGVRHRETEYRFEGEQALYFEDPDGLGLELVFNNRDARPPMARGPVPSKCSIRGFHHVALWEEGYERTAALLTGQLDHTLIRQTGNRFRFGTTDAPGHYVDVVCAPDSLRALRGAGTVHHVAFTTADRDTQEEVRRKVIRQGFDPTPVLNRNYFTSIYFREPGGVLFEVATQGPGFSLDEPPGHLGETLRLPPQYENRRAELEKKLPVISLQDEKYR